MKLLCFHPMFFLGLVIRLVFIAIITPVAVSNWYAPFLYNSISVLTFDPWANWMAAGQTFASFPYGYVMWLAFLPIISITKLVGVSIQVGYELTLLVADFCLLITFHKLFPERQRFLLASYWLSPIVIFASYALGFNDVIPTLLLSLSILFIYQFKLKLSGILCAAAISAKLSMIVALPFFIIYLYNNKALRQRVSLFLFGLLTCMLILEAPFLFSSASFQMLLNNPEIEKIYGFALRLGNNISIYIVPLIYMIMLYLTWRIRRLNFDLFQATTGIAFLLIVLLTPASPGWFIWSIPFLIFYQAMNGLITSLLTGGFLVLYIVSTLLATPLQFINGRNFELSSMLHMSGQLGFHIASLLHTITVAIGIVLVIRIWYGSIKRNNFFRLSQKPFVIGIAGDSGSGKDTFTDALTGLFGRHSVVQLSGDNYHNWDRHKPMWQVITHLNPLANDLESFSSDLISLIDGKSIQSRQYNHQTGKMSRPFQIRSNDFIIASGLHTLYLPVLRHSYNLKIYLDISEELRRYFKVKRDIQQRDYSIEQVLKLIQKRESDSVRFIRPQASHADLVFALQPIYPKILENFDNKNPLRLKLIVKTRHEFNGFSIKRVLVSLCGLYVNTITHNKGTIVEMIIEGDTFAEDIAMAAKILCPNVFEFLDISPQWHNGMLGLMQLITISHINQALTKRFFL